MGAVGGVISSLPLLAVTIQAAQDCPGLPGIRLGYGTRDLSLPALLSRMLPPCFHLLCAFPCLPDPCISQDCPTQDHPSRGPVSLWAGQSTSVHQHITPQSDANHFIAFLHHILGSTKNFHEPKVVRIVPSVFRAAEPLAECVTDFIVLLCSLSQRCMLHVVLTASSPIFAQSTHVHI